MLLSLIGTAFFMGLVGGVHCLAMCAAPCAVITAPGGVRGNACIDAKSCRSPAIWHGCAFHIGRLASYSFLGGVAAYASAQLAWLSDRSFVLHPVWIGLHLLAFAWGGNMLLGGRQPRWVEVRARALWQTVQAWFKRPVHSAVAGCLWMFFPCGLLYSALFVAALGHGFAQGATVMLAFGLGSGVWLWGGTWLWRKLLPQSAMRESMAIRLAGTMLALISLWALWVDLVQQPALWCR